MGLRLAVITGGAGDIGQAIARRLRQDHDLVVLADLDLAAATKVVSALGAGFAALQVDVTKPESCADLARQIAIMGNLATLVNNAGASWAVSVQQCTPESWIKDRALNFDGMFMVFHALAAQLIAAKGSVVNIASVILPIRRQRRG